MDPITTAILSAIAAGIFSGTTEVGERAILDAYKKLKGLLARKFGTRSRVIKAIKELEANPKSEVRKAVVKEEVAAINANEDVDLLKAAQALIRNIKTREGGNQNIQTAIGDANIQITGTGNVINVGKPKSND